MLTSEPEELSKMLSAAPTLANEKRVRLLPCHGRVFAVSPCATESIGVSEISLRRYMPRPAGLIDMADMSAPSEVKAPPSAMARAVPKFAGRDSEAKSSASIRS